MKKRLITLRGLVAAVIVQLAVLAGSAHADFTLTYTGSQTTITLDPGIYDIIAYGAQGGNLLDSNAPNGNVLVEGGFGAEISGQFTFLEPTTLTILVGGQGGHGVVGHGGGGGGGAASSLWEAHHWSSPAQAAVAASFPAHSVPVVRVSPAAGEMRAITPGT